MKESFELKATFNVKPDIIYQAWLDSKGHAEMTGGDANCSDQVGENFDAWNGYITGKNISLTPNEEIIQSWRTLEFETHHEDSELIIRLKEIDNGTELTLIHNNIPQGQTQYEQGWIDNYFDPMKACFESQAS